MTDRSRGCPGTGRHGGTTAQPGTRRRVRARLPGKEGLVNVNISDLDVQIPIGVAANVCDVTVAGLAVLAGLVVDEAAAGDASADPDSTITLVG